MKSSQTIALDGIDIEQASIRWVCRGGLKLEAALNAFDGPDSSGALCLDVGASTGGFSDVLLSGGRGVFAWQMLAMANSLKS